MAEEIIIHIDGTCSGKSSDGGWSAVMSDGKIRAVLVGGEPRTTMNRMEMTAFMEALNILDALKYPVRIISRSAYLVANYTERLDGWENSGWKKMDGKPVKNEDLWRKILRIKKSLKAQPEIVLRSHSDDQDDATNFAVRARIRVEETGEKFREKLRPSKRPETDIVSEMAREITGETAPNTEDLAMLPVATPPRDPAAGARVYQAHANRGGLLAFRMLAESYARKEIGLEKFYDSVRSNVRDIF